MSSERLMVVQEIEVWAVVDEVYSQCEILMEEMQSQAKDDSVVVQIYLAAFCTFRRILSEKIGNMLDVATIEIDRPGE